MILVIRVAVVGSGSGCLSFWFGNDTTEIALDEGDSVTFPRQMPVSWRNKGLVDCRAVLVEQLRPDAWGDADVNRRDGGGPSADPAT